MTALLLWFLLGQTLGGLPAMEPGTSVWLMSPDLLTVYARAEVVEGELRFDARVEPGTPIRVSIFPPGLAAADRSANAEAATFLDGRVSDDGSDVIVRLVDREDPLSLRDWLARQRGLALAFGDP